MVWPAGWSTSPSPHTVDVSTPELWLLNSSSPPPASCRTRKNSRLLSALGHTMCTAESCTGGYIAHLLTSIPGSSSFYDGSVISYSYKAKEDLLNVSKELLQTKGAVSEDVVIQMAQGALATIQANYVIAVSGIMGPEGGLPDKPVGTVWIAVGDKNKIETKKLHFRFDRQRNTQLTATNALNMLRKFILADQERKINNLQQLSITREAQ